MYRVNVPKYSHAGSGFTRVLETVTEGNENHTALEVACIKAREEMARFKPRFVTVTDEQGRVILSLS